MSPGAVVATPVTITVVTGLWCGGRRQAARFTVESTTMDGSGVTVLAREEGCQSCP